jgi:RHS repeat-associated protein
MVSIRRHIVPNPATMHSTHPRAMRCVPRFFLHTRYDVFDRQVAKDQSVGGMLHERYVYDGANLLLTFAVNDNVATVKERYLNGLAVDQVLACEDAAHTVDWLLSDNEGTVRDVVQYNSLTNHTTVVDHLVYNSFGEVKSQTNSTEASRFTYTGRQWDASAEMYYYRARWYDPKTGDFANEDPLGLAAGDMNLYRYCGNSPTNLVDPSGMEGCGTAQGPVIPAPERTRETSGMGETGQASASCPSMPAFPGASVPTFGTKAPAVCKKAQPVGVMRGASGGETPVQGYEPRTTRSTEPAFYRLRRESEPGDYFYPGRNPGEEFWQFVLRNVLLTLSNPSFQNSMAFGGPGSNFGGALNQNLRLKAPNAAEGESPVVFEPVIRPRFKTLRPGPYAAESIPLPNAGRPATAAQQRLINDIGREFGCHTCGSRVPGTKSGNFILDHQPPTMMLFPGVPQRGYPQCLHCSSILGGGFGLGSNRQ